MENVTTKKNRKFIDNGYSYTPKDFGKKILFF